MDRNNLLKQIMALRFCLVDLNLYLDTHTFDKEIISLYSDYENELNGLIKKYEGLYGPLTATVTRDDFWNWTQNPWPWENSENNEMEDNE